MRSFQLGTAIEGLTEAEQAERQAYKSRLRKMPIFDVTTEEGYYAQSLEDLGEILLNQPESEAAEYLGYRVKEFRWKRDACAAESHNRRTRDLLPVGGAVGLAPTFIEELKGRLDITVVVEASGVQLKKCGTRLVGLCPFHDERHPSFLVYPANQSWFCFSCRAGGDVIAFLQRINSEDFITSVKRMCQVAGIDMPGRRFA